MLLILNGFDLEKLMPNFLFYVIFTPIIAVTTNKIMFASENTMMAQDALNRIEGIVNEKLFSYSNSSNHIINSDIEFKNVSFSYQEGKQVFQKVNFIAKQNEITALIGNSGGGKKTCASLAAQLDQGMITIGGIDISTIEPELFLSIVFQAVVLFNNTILENIRIEKKCN